MASTSTAASGGASGVTVTSPSRRPLKGTCSPRGRGAGEPQDGHDRQREAGCGTVSVSCVLSLRSAIQWRDIVPGAQTERRGGAGPVGGLLGGKDPTGRLTFGGLAFFG